MAGVTKVGDLIYWTITITNNGPHTNTGVYVIDELPAGLEYKSYTASKGTFNKNDGKWTVGVHNVGATHTLKLVYRVIDISEGVEYPESSGVYGFLNKATVYGDNIDPNDADNNLEFFTEITTCTPAGGANNDTSACLCGSVAGNDTPCSHGTTQYRIKIGSLTNLDATFVLNTDGSYNANGKILNPFEDASFEYSMWCIVGDDEYEVSGPATVVIPALLHADSTDSVTDNGDGTFTHKSLNGTEVTWNAGWTTVVEDDGAKTITFTYPDATVVVVDISDWFSAADELSVYPSVITSNVALTNLTMKNYHKIDDSGYVDINIVLPDPATLGLSANTTKRWTFKRINDYDTGSITLTPDNSKKIDDEISYVFPGNDKLSVSLWTDGTDYFIE